MLPDRNPVVSFLNLFCASGIIATSLLLLAGCKNDLGDRNSAAPAPSPNQQPGDLISNRWKAGVDYETLPSPQIPSSTDHSIPVVEFFWYACPHCYTLEPQLVLWNKQKPDYIKLVQIPVPGGPISDAHARLYYTLEALGRADLHATVFDTIHRQKNLLIVRNDAQATLDLQTTFAVTHGIPKELFLQAFTSSRVLEQLEKAKNLAKLFQVESIPTLIVNGKYKTGGGFMHDQNDMLQLITEMAQSERMRLVSPASESSK